MIVSDISTRPRKKHPEIIPLEDKEPRASQDVSCTWIRDTYNIHYIYIHICSILYIYHTYTHIHSYIHACIDTFIVRSYIHTYMHPYIHAYIHIYIHAYLHTYILTYILTYIHTDIQTYRHTDITDIQTYRHTDIHTYIYTCRSCHHYRTELRVQKYGKIPYFRTPPDPDSVRLRILFYN